MTAFRRAFTAAAVVWMVLLPLAAFAASGQPSTAAYTLALAVYGIGSFVCHQRPERSFHLGAAQLPVCARCAGIYLGAALAACASIGARALQAAPNVRLKPDATYVRGLLLAAALPTAATLLFEWTTGQTPSNITRAIAGLPLGAAVAWIVCKVN